MPRDILYLDLETQRTANDAGGWDRKGNMQMSIGVTYSTKTGRYEVFSEARVHDLIERLRRADLVVGFNVLNFDYHVSMGIHGPGSLLELPHGRPHARYGTATRSSAWPGHDCERHSWCAKTAAGLDAIPGR